MKRTNYIFTLLLAFLIAGCATTASIRSNYTRIDYSDGINAEEAKLIAKNHLISTASKHDYQIISPLILRNEEVRKYPDIWFIRFHPKKMHLMPYFYLVMVSKDTGEIVSYGKRRSGGGEI